MYIALEPSGRIYGYSFNDMTGASDWFLYNGVIPDNFLFEHTNYRFEDGQLIYDPITEDFEISPTPEEQLRADVDFLLAMGGMIE